MQKDAWMWVRCGTWRRNSPVTNYGMELLQSEMKLQRKKSDEENRWDEAEEALLSAAETELDAAGKAGLPRLMLQERQVPVHDVHGQHVHRDHPRHAEGEMTQCARGVWRVGGSSSTPKLIKVRAEMEVVVAASERSSTIVSKLTSVMRQLCMKTDTTEKEAVLVRWSNGVTGWRRKS
jgi:hypothetical protein